MSASSSAFNNPALSSSGPIADLVHEAAQGSVLDLRIVRGPLNPQEDEAILSQYNRLASANIPMEAYLRWVRQSPEGPAWHALLQTRDREIVGHTSLFPFRGLFGGQRMVVAKSEYSFIREEFRAAKIRGYEQSGRLKNLIYIDELFRRCRSEGWSPLFISTLSSYQRVFGSIGCYPVRFPLWECLLVLRPGAAARTTPNLRGWQRASLWSAGLVQASLWRASLLLSSQKSDGIRSMPPDARQFGQSGQFLSCFQDQECLSWRFPEGEYERIVAGGEGGGDLVVKNGSLSRYLRVCQWHLNSGPPKPALLARLVQMASQQQALGVRWAVYGQDAASEALVRRLRNYGFLCARRVRTLLINTASQQFLDPKTWGLTDAMFTFDL